jgi:hypothetical protein
MERVRLAAARIDYITGLEVVDHHRRVAMQTAQRFRLTRSAMAIAQREEKTCTYHDSRRRHHRRDGWAVQWYAPNECQVRR